MGFLSSLANTGKALTSQLGDAIGKAVDQTGAIAKQSAEIAALKMELSTVEQEFEQLYIIVGRKYVDYILETDTKPVINIDAEFRAILPKIKRRDELKAKINELEKNDRQNRIMAEYNAAQNEYIEQKRKLDQALQMDIITQAEYDEKLLKYKTRVDNFDEIRRVQMQYDMGIINKEELNSKLRALGMNPSSFSIFNLK